MWFYNENKVYIAEELYYSIFRIKKRVIFAPCPELKKIQRYMKRAINWAFPLKIDTRKSAQIHSDKKWVLKMDIKDFYNSVPYENIERVMKTVSKKVKYADVNKYLIYTTIENKLPTGAPTSAHIANACFRHLDNRIKIFCKNYGINYSRYMDDLTFSSDEKFYLNMIEDYVTKLLESSGYKINKQKTKYISNNKQQNILGLVVNNGDARIPKNLKRRIRAMLHSYSLYKYHSATADVKHRVWDKKGIDKLNGYLGYIKRADPKYYEKLKQYCKRLSLK